MEWTPYLNFDGDCAEAFQFYAKVLGGKIAALQTYGESPMAADVPEAMRQRVLHARLEKGSLAIMGADAAPGKYERPQGFSIAVHDTPMEALRLFETLGDGGTVQMPLQKTFFAERFGMVVDRFGIPWIITGDERSE